MKTGEDKKYPGPYDDIIDLPHHVSRTRPPMSAGDRAAQFSPFAALTGFGAVITEAGRYTDARPELDEQQRAELDWRLQRIQERISEQPEIGLTYFAPDMKKAGGQYITTTGRVKKLDVFGGSVILADGRAIPIQDITDIEPE